jgi:hypothetical protein
VSGASVEIKINFVSSNPDVCILFYRVYIQAGGIDIMSTDFCYTSYFLYKPQRQ